MIVRGLRWKEFPVMDNLQTGSGSEEFDLERPDEFPRVVDRILRIPHLDAVRHGSASQIAAVGVAPMLPATGFGIRAGRVDVRGDLL